MIQRVIARADMRNDRRRTRQCMFGYSLGIGILLHNARSHFGTFFDIVSFSYLFHNHYHHRRYPNRKFFNTISSFYVRHDQPERHKMLRLSSVQGSPPK